MPYMLTGDGTPLMERLRRDMPALLCPPEDDE